MLMFLISLIFWCWSPFLVHRMTPSTATLMFFLWLPSMLPQLLLLSLWCQFFPSHFHGIELQAIHSQMFWHFPQHSSSISGCCSVCPVCSCVLFTTLHFPIIHIGTFLCTIFIWVLLILFSLFWTDLPFQSSHCYILGLLSSQSALCTLLYTQSSSFSVCTSLSTWFSLSICNVASDLPLCVPLCLSPFFFFQGIW